MLSKKSLHEGRGFGATRTDDLESDKRYLFWMLFSHKNVILSEALRIATVVVCGRKAPKSMCQQASPGSFDSAP
jgi:hypothetical protein